MTKAPAPAPKDAQRRRGPASAGERRSGSESHGPASPLSLHVPEPAQRPGDPPVFDWFDRSHPDASWRPPISTPPAAMRDLAYGLIRVLDDEGFAAGPWNPRLPNRELRTALRTMLITRAFDDRMFRAQRQGKTSFFMKCRGEEAVSVGAALALRPDDMTFPTYRQPGLLVARGCPLDEMMCQILSNAADPLKGRQMPVFYSSRERGFFSISGNLATQFSQAVGWAMASAYKGDCRISGAWIGEGATAEGDFHYALTLATVYQAPSVLSVVNNQWAISSFEGIARGGDTTFAARGIGYGAPSLRVDGNDLLAVFAVTRWAADRARANLGPTLIELVTYRAEGHSTSDDPARYRPLAEAAAWPMGDPVERLSQHLDASRGWGNQTLDGLKAEAAELVEAAFQRSQAIGMLGSGERASPATMFDDVYREQPWHLRRQRQQAGY